MIDPILIEKLGNADDRDRRNKCDSHHLLKHIYALEYIPSHFSFYWDISRKIFFLLHSIIANSHEHEFSCIELAKAAQNENVIRNVM